MVKQCRSRNRIYIYWCSCCICCIVILRFSYILSITYLEFSIVTPYKYMSGLPSPSNFMVLILCHKCFIFYHRNPQTPKELELVTLLNIIKVLFYYLPMWVLSIPWIRLNPTTKIPHNSHPYTGAGTTLSLILIWTHTLPMQKLITRIEKIKLKRCIYNGFHLNK